MGLRLKTASVICAAAEFWVFGVDLGMSFGTFIAFFTSSAS